MAKFCKYCGKQLNESQACTCIEAQQLAGRSMDYNCTYIQQENQADAQPEHMYQVPTNETLMGNSKIKNVLTNLIPFIKAYICSPASTTKTALDNRDMPLAITFMEIFAVMTGLFLFTAFSRIFTYLDDAFRNAANKAKSILGSDIFKNSLDITVPFFTIFIYGLLIAVILLVVYILALFVLSKIMKSTIDIRYIIISCGVNLILPTICLVISMICMLFNFYISMAFLLLAVIFLCTCGIMICKTLISSQDNGRFHIGYAVIFCIVLILTGYINGKIVTSAIGNVEISGEKISDVIGEIRNTENPYGVFSELFQ